MIKKTLQGLDESGIVLEHIVLSRWRPPPPKSTGSTTVPPGARRKKLRLATIGEELECPPLQGSSRNDFRTVAARRKEGGKILGFVTLIRDGESAFGYYVGFDKAGAARRQLYMSLVYACVARAIEMRASLLVLGRTALGPKAQIGTKPQAMYDYLRHRRMVLNLAVLGSLAVLPTPKQAPDRHPFKE